MSKRKLDSKYKDLVEYVKDMKDGTDLKGVLDWLNGGFKEVNGLEIVSIIDKLDDSSDEFISTIVDIYNDNYELEDPKFYWEFIELTGNYGIPFYAFEYLNVHKIGLRDEGDLSEEDTVKMSKAHLASLLSDTNLTIDNFRPVEELE